MSGTIMNEENAFRCWICGCEVHEMHEIAQNLCDNCKASIIRKNKDNLPIDEFLEQMKKKLQDKEKIS